MSNPERDSVSTAGRTTTETSAYDRLIALLDDQRSSYRIIDHAPEGRTELVSAMRGHSVDAAAKCIVIMAKIGKKITKYLLVVVAGDAKVDLAAVKALVRGTYVSFASADIAEELAGSVMGTVLPFAFDPRLELVVDPGLLEHPEIYFNAARLDRSLALSTADYRRIAQPRIERVAAR
jgi:Ala-tRNA(Pro) deacylase